jgi:hypothetical protein
VTDEHTTVIGVDVIVVRDVVHVDGALVEDTRTTRSEDTDVGDTFRQGFLLGVAEDLGKIIEDQGSAEVPAGR